MRPFAAIAFTLFCLATAAAQTPSGNVDLGYSYYNTELPTTLNVGSYGRIGADGWEASFEEKVLPILGVVADFNVNYLPSQTILLFCPASLSPCGPAGEKATDTNYLFGPRIGVQLGRLRPFAEFLVGAGHLSAQGTGGITFASSNTSFATAVGGGLDYKLFHFIAWRAQGDYVHTSFLATGVNNARFSTGIVFRF
jgi:opacity protein-like surface antigen